MLMLSMSTAGSSSGSHACVFCNQEFTCKTDLQTHFRRHANGEIDIKGRPKMQQKAEEKCYLEEEEKVEKKDMIKKSPDEVAGKKADGSVCDVCGEVFRTVSLAISHKFRKHPESVIKHYCPHCGMMFPIKINRDKHLLTHTGMAPKQLFPCLTCGVAFYNFRARKFHMDSAHKGAIRMVNPIKTPAPSLKIVLNNAGEAHSVYYCHLCGCEYQVKYNLQKHLATRHTEEERDAVPEEVMQCNVCSALFYSKRAYEAHNHHHRESDLYATNEEMRQQVVQRIDQDFDQRRVPTTVERYLSASAISSNRSATWRNIRAAKRNQEITQTSPLCEATQEKSISLAVTDNENSLVHSKPDISTMSNTMSTEPPNVVDCFLQEGDSCWESQGQVSRKRLIDDGEEDQEISRLGTVNPDTVMPNPGMILGQSNEDQESNNEKQQKTKVMAEKTQEFEDDTEKQDQSELAEEKDICQSKGDSNDSEGSDGDLVVEKIVGMRKATNGREFLVRWQGFEPADDTWEREEFLNCGNLISDFLKNRKGKPDGQGLEAPIEWYEAPKRKKRKEQKSKGGKTE